MSEDGTSVATAPGHRLRFAAVRHAWLLLIVVVALAPRLASLVAPTLWVEDDAYLGCALALARGELPYHDFVLQHAPVLEQLTAAWLAITGPSVVAIEVLTQATIIALLGLLAVIGWRVAGPRTAAVAVVLAATAPLLWRYRLFHRELFLALPVLLAVVLVTSPRRSTTRAVTIGALLALALLVKFTALAYAIAIVVALAVDRSWGRRAAAVSGATFVAVAGGAVILFAGILGLPFVVQVILFGLQVPGFDDPLLKLVIVTRDLVPLLVVAVVGAVWIVAAQAAARWRPVLLAALVGGVFVLVLKPIGWGHNALELLPWAALLAAAAISRGAELVPTRHASLAAAGLVAGLLAVTLLWFGFGPQVRGPRRWISQAEIRALAAATRASSAPYQRVFVPSLVAFAADRRELVVNFEIAAWSRELTEQAEQEGLSALLGDLGRLRGRPYFRVVDDSLAATAEAAVAAVRDRHLAVVATPHAVARSPLFPFALDGELLRVAGYRPIASTSHYLLWGLNPAGGLETRRPSP